MRLQAVFLEMLGFLAVCSWFTQENVKILKEKMNSPIACPLTRRWFAIL